MEIDPWVIVVILINHHINVHPLSWHDSPEVDSGRTNSGIQFISSPNWVIWLMKLATKLTLFSVIFRNEKSQTSTIKGCEKEPDIKWKEAITKLKLTSSSLYKTKVMTSAQINCPISPSRPSTGRSLPFPSAPRKVSTSMPSRNNSQCQKFKTLLPWPKSHSLWGILHRK